MSRRRAALVGLVGIAAAQPARLPAQSNAVAASRITLAAGEQYRTGWLHRLLLGTHYRRLWAMPVSVEVLNLTTYAGGLTPERCGGGMQTHSLRLGGDDGRAYVFRSVEKDAELALPPDLRHTFPAELVQDQISASHPGAPLVVAPLLQAVGVLHATPHLFVLADDPRLAAFACVRPGELGMLEERPTGGGDDELGFAGAAEVISTAKLFDHLENKPTHRVDRAAFLAARLLDVYVGDLDRHRDQWRWARFDSSGSHWWKPIPRDRDQAFERFDGVLLWLARSYFPKIVVFGDRYSSLYGLTLTGETLDRRDRPPWATRGVLFTISGSAYPATLDVRRAFGAITAQAATYLTVPHAPTLALRVAGSRVFGPYPFHEAAFVGGGTTVRGYAEHRFAGDAALVGNAELRVSLARLTALLPIEFGVFGLADAGRVFLAGETSDVWHGAAGGGLWFAFLSRTNTLTIATARSPENTGLYVRAGFAY